MKTALIDHLALAALELYPRFEVQAFAEHHGVSQDEVQQALRDLRDAGDIQGHRPAGTLDITEPYLTDRARWRWSLGAVRQYLPDYDPMALRVHTYLQEQEQASAEAVQQHLGLSDEDTQRYLTLMRWGTTIQTHVGPGGRITTISRK